MAARKDSTTPAEVPAETTPEPTLCGCGCGAATKPGRSFCQGHDAKLHGVLARALREGATEATLADGRVVVIAEAYEARGWQPAKPRVSRKLSPEARVARLREQLAAAEAALVPEAV